jgi:hypothetical protein
MGECNVLLNSHDCTHTTRATCFACGNDACTGCSKRMNWHRHQRVRVCADCQEEQRKDAIRVTRPSR